MRSLPGAMSPGEPESRAKGHIMSHMTSESDKSSIIVVEDEADIREVLVYNLKRQGYAVSGCGDGLTGLALIEEKRPGLVLLDLMLPGLDGLEICRRLKGGAATAMIPIIMVTAKGEESDIVAGLEL